MKTKRSLKLLESILTDLGYEIEELNNFRLIVNLKNTLQVAFIEGECYDDLFEGLIFRKNDLFPINNMLDMARIDTFKEVLEYLKEVESINLLRLKEYEVI